MSLTSTEVAGATPLVPPSISALGTAHLDANGALAGSAQIYHLAAPGDGPATLSLNATGFAPVLGVYDASGTQRLAVASRTSPGLITMQIPAAAGAGYLIRVGVLSGAQAGVST
jgi:hypothetical protein